MLNLVNMSKYKPTRPFPVKKDFIEVEFLSSKRGQIRHLSFDEEGFKRAICEYQKELTLCDLLFKKDVLEYVGVSSHPKANELFHLAYTLGHDEGYEKIVFWAEKLSELLK